MTLLFRGLQLALAWLLFTSTAVGQLAAGVEIPYTRYQLDNGLTLLVHEDNKAPIVAVNIWYHVGSKDERPGITGFAHLFEHLMFNGSENYDGEWFLPMELAGGTDLNGTTWFDRTNYFQTVPTPALDMVLWMESDRMGHMLGAITQEKLDEQRGVVQNEKRQGDNQPYGRAGYLQLAAMFPEGHPYRWSTIGSMEDLEAASLEDVYEWFKTYYGAANAVLVVAGDVDPEQVYERVQHYFGDISPGPPLSRPERWIAKRTETTREVMYDQVPQSRLTLAWNTAPFGDVDNVYLQVAAAILGGGRNSRLYKRLVYDDQIATSIAASQMGFEIAGMFEIEAYLKPGADPAQLETAIAEEIARFLEQGPTRDELERVKTSYFASLIRGLEKVGGFAGKAQLLAEYETYLGDAARFKQDLSWWEGASARQIRDASVAWLSNGDYNQWVHPQPAFRAASEGADRSAMPAPGDAPDIDMPLVEEYRLSNGIKVLFAQHGTLPLVNMSMIFDAGYVADAAVTPGTATLVGQMLNEGTARYSSLELADLQERLGARISAGSSLDTTSVSLAALEANLTESLNLYAEVVRNPSFPEADLRRVRSNLLDRIAREKADPQQLAMRNLPPLLYPEGHPYGIPFTGSGDEVSVASIERQQLADFHQTWIRPDNATLVVVGSTPWSELQPELNRVFGNWQPPATPLPTKTIATDLPERPTNLIYLLDRPGAAQSTIMGAQILPPTNWEETDLLDMAVRALGGTFNARLNMNLREDKGWAYGVRAFAPNARGNRPLIYFAPVQTDKTLESLQEIIRELDEYRGINPLQDSELHRNREGILRSLPGRLETGGALLGSLADMVSFGRPLDYLEISQETLKAMQTPDVARVAAEQLEKTRTVWLIVGDLAQIEEGLRASGIADVILLTP